MKLAWLVLLLTGCTTASNNSAAQTVGSGTVNINGIAAATAAWMTPGTYNNDSTPDAPTKYIGWSVTFAQVAPGTPCTDPSVRYPSWTANITVYSETTGSLPEDAPITPGNFQFKTPAGPPSAGIQEEFEHKTGLGSAGTLMITAFDNQDIEGSFVTSGMTSELVPTSFSSDGTFAAMRCDF